MILAFEEFQGADENTNPSEICFATLEIDLIHLLTANKLVEVKNVFNLEHNGPAQGVAQLD